MWSVKSIVKNLFATAVLFFLGCAFVGGIRVDISMGMYEKCWVLMCVGCRETAAADGLGDNASWQRHAQMCSGAGDAQPLGLGSWTSALAVKPKVRGHPMVCGNPCTFGVSRGADRVVAWKIGRNQDELSSWESAVALVETLKGTSRYCICPSSLSRLVPNALIKLKNKNSCRFLDYVMRPKLV
jgi:hypothetical protein